MAIVTPFIRVTTDLEGDLRRSVELRTRQKERDQAHMDTQADSTGKATAGKVAPDSVELTGDRSVRRRELEEQLMKDCDGTAIIQAAMKAALAEDKGDV